MSLIALPHIIGHRCARASAPENTLAGLKLAAAARAPCETGLSGDPWTTGASSVRAWVEVDVRLTADGVPVLLHDSTLERTTNGRGSIAAALWADVRRLDAGETFDPAFAGEPVPALADFLEAALEYDVGVNLELKGTPEDAATVAEVALTVARALWQPGGPGANHPPPLISSFAPSALEAAARIAPD